MVTCSFFSFPAAVPEDVILFLDTLAYAQRPGTMFLFVSSTPCVRILCIYPHVLDSPGCEFAFNKVTRAKRCNKWTHLQANRVGRVVG